MALFVVNSPPHEFGWSTQWKTWLNNLWEKLTEFLADPEFSGLTVTGNSFFDGDIYGTGSLEIEEDLSAEDAAFGGEVTIAEDLSVGGFFYAENSPDYTGPVLTTSGTAHPLVVPRWARRIIFVFMGVSTNGTSSYIIQLGTDLGLVVTGYLGVASSASAIINMDTGFALQSAAVAAGIYHGVATIQLGDPNTNTWGINSALGRSDSAAQSQYAQGTVSLPGPVTQVNLTTIGGVNTFDAGKINVYFE